ncbi:MAG: hypothetical protein UEF48_00715 [Agathobaculum butyriciproducens]|nr:hypothetical protein [Agathobaculum butyriciproducens]
MSIRDYKITDAQIAEKGVIASPDTLTGTADENKRVFDRLVRECVAPQFNEIVETFADMEESTTEWSGEEAKRQQAEQGRVSAETARVSAEAARAQVESTRRSAEAARQQAESARDTAETARANAENKRDTAEKSRASAETGRVNAESARVTAESQRANAESVRAQNEAARISAETGRADAEADRVSAEDTRIANENARKSAETDRASAETVRESGENARKSAEKARASAEQQRESTESTRQTSEAARVSAEKNRAAAETVRQTAEKARNVWEEYSASKAYVPGNKVSFNGSSYVCTAATTGHAPTDIAYWLLIAQKGADGKGAGDMLASVYDPKGKAQDVFSFASSEAADAVSTHDAAADAHSAQFAKKQDKIKGKKGKYVGFTANDTVGEVDAPASGGSRITLTFASDFVGQVWTLKGGGETYTGTVDSSLTASVSVLGINTTYTLSCVLSGATHTAEVTTKDYFTALNIELSFTNVFGVCWDTSNSSTELTRLTPSTDPYGLVTRSVTTEPKPAVGTGSGSSPFDSYAPWSGMKECNLDASGTVTAWKGDSSFARTNNYTMVFVPEFYVAAKRNGTKQYFYVSDKPKNGMTKHPGSGKYVGKYHARENPSDYIEASMSGQAPEVNVKRSAFRSKIKAIGDKFHLYDFATYCAIIFLYIVEFADWNCQNKIAYGRAKGQSSAVTSGKTDTMVYHTGTAGSRISDSAAAMQYRWIENLWGNVFQWVDGFNANGKTAYYCTDPSKYADDTSTGYTNIGTLPASGWIKDLTVTDNGLLIPKTSGGSETTYVPDYVYSSSSGWCVLYVGGDWDDGAEAGLLCFRADSASSSSSSDISARLLCEA